MSTPVEDRPRGLVPSDRERRAGVLAPSFTEPTPAQLAAGGAFAPQTPLEPPPPTLIERARDQLDPRTVTGEHATKPLVVIAIAALFAQWDDAAFTVLLPDIRADFGLDLAVVGALGAIVLIVAQLFGPLVGYVADRVRRTRMLAAGGLFAGVAACAAGAAGGAGSLGLARAGSGAGQAFSVPATFPLLTDYYPLERRGRVFAFVAIAGGFGLLVAPGVAGLLGDWIGWRATLVLFGAITAVASVAFFTLRDPVRGRLDRLDSGVGSEAADDEPPPVGWREGWRAASAIGSLRRFWYATPFLVAAGGSFATFVSLYFSEEFAVGSTGRGAITSAMAVVSLVGLLTGGPLTDRVLKDDPGRVVVLIGWILVLDAFAVLVLVLSPWLWLSIAAALPAGVGLALMVPAIRTLAALVVPARLRGFGIETASPWAVLGVAVLPLVGALGDEVGLREAMIVLVPLYLVGAAVIASAAGEIQRDIDLALAAAEADRVAAAARAEGGERLLTVRGLEVRHEQAVVLAGVDLDLDAGQVLAVLGTNGAGKSSLLRALAGLHAPSAGAVVLDGIDTTFRPPHEIARTGVTLVPGGQGVAGPLTVDENLRLAEAAGRATDEQRATIARLFGPLLERGAQRADTLSGGEQQQLALAQAILTRPRLLLVDELSLGLAPTVVAGLVEAVGEIARGGTSVIVVEQTVHLALDLAPRTLFLDRGKVVFDGPTDELVTRTDLLRSVFLHRAAPGSTRATAGGSGRRAGDVLLKLDGVSASYGGIQALAGVDLTVAAGEVVGLVGPNGAGKSTLLDVITGFVKPDGGTLRLEHEDVADLPPHARADRGLVRSAQTPRLYGGLSVQECVALARERHLDVRDPIRPAVWSGGARASERAAQADAVEQLERLGLMHLATRSAAELSVGQRRLVELACALAAEPRVLLLDEPCAGLAQPERLRLRDLIGSVSATGVAVVLVEHDLDIVAACCDRVLVLHLGRPLASGAPSTVLEDPAVLAAYVGASGGAHGRVAQALDALNDQGAST